MNTINELVQSLSRDMGVSEADLICFAQSVANSMKKDKLTQKHAEQVGIVTAYASHAIRKFQQFQTKILTSEEAKKAFMEKIYADVRSFNDNAKTFDDLND